MINRQKSTVLLYTGNKILELKFKIPIHMRMKNRKCVGINISKTYKEIQTLKIVNCTKILKKGINKWRDV